MESDKPSCQKHNFPSFGEESPWWDESKKCVKEGPGRQVCQSPRPGKASPTASSTSGSHRSGNAWVGKSPQEEQKSRQKTQCSRSKGLHVSAQADRRAGNIATYKHTPTDACGHTTPTDILPPAHSHTGQCHWGVENTVTS